MVDKVLAFICAFAGIMVAFSLFVISFYMPTFFIFILVRSLSALSLVLSIKVLVVGEKNE